MSSDSQRPSRTLPASPDLTHLKRQAKGLLRTGKIASLAEAQFQFAREYGFASWPKLKTHIEAIQEVGQLKAAVDANDLARVQALMTRNPSLRRAPLGYGNNGPLTWVAECRVPRVTPGEVRLAMARWMIANGSDVHQGEDGPLMRAALDDTRLPMLELLVEHGADVTARWNVSHHLCASRNAAVQNTQTADRARERRKRPCRDRCRWLWRAHAAVSHDGDPGQPK